jgi:cysteinyl-tRNA synthetase
VIKRVENVQGIKPINKDRPLTPMAMAKKPKSSVDLESTNMKEEDIVFFLGIIDSLRKEGYYRRADCLREMLRRMGYEVKNNKDGASSIKIIWT